MQSYEVEPPSSQEVTGLSVFLVQVWLMVAVSVVAGLVGILAIIDLALAREVELGTRVLVGAVALLVPVVGVPVWGFIRRGWQRAVALVWLSLTIVALVNVFILLPTVRHG